MNTKTLERLIRDYLQPSLKGFQIHRRLLYRVPPSPLVRGFYFAMSRYPPRAFAVEVFVQPCYIPSETVWFNMGTRLGRISGGAEKWWEIESADQAGEIMRDVLRLIEDEGLPYLDERDSLQDIVRAYGPRAREPNALLMEAVSGALVILGEHKRGTHLIDQLIATCHKHLSESPFVADELARAEELKKALLRSPIDARQLLEDRISRTLTALGLG